jgi:hypothetical protein
MLKTREISLLNIAEGSIMEQVNVETARVLANILDPNTDPKTERKITITIAFKADENRELIDCKASVVSKLSAYKQVTSRLFAGLDADGNPTASELFSNHPGQLSMMTEGETQNVIQIRKAAQIND